MSLIDKANDIITNGNEKYPLIKSFAGENIKGYLQHFKIKGGSIATVGSSGDQAISALVAGAESVLICDTCPFTGAFTDLKLAALQSLNRKDFIDFLSQQENTQRGYGNDDFLSRKKFKKVSGALERINENSYQFWDYLTLEHPQQDRLKIFRTDDPWLEEIQFNINYLRSNQSYEYARKTLSGTRVQFIWGNIQGRNLKGTYDTIFLSDVLLSSSPTERQETINNCKAQIVTGGKILVAYYKAREDYKTGLGIGEDVENSCTLIKNSRYSSKGKDYVLVYTKND